MILFPFVFFFDLVLSSFIKNCFLHVHKNKWNGGKQGKMRITGNFVPKIKLKNNQKNETKIRPTYIVRKLRCVLSLVPLAECNPSQPWFLYLLKKYKCVYLVALRSLSELIFYNSVKLKIKIFYFLQSKEKRCDIFYMSTSKNFIKLFTYHKTILIFIKLRKFGTGFLTFRLASFSNITGSIFM